MERKEIMLQPSERVVMQQLWEEQPLTGTVLFHRLEEACGWSKSTVNTMLKRMHEKGLIRYEQGEKAKLYYPEIEEEDANYTETNSLLERVFNGSVSMMMSTILKGKKLTDKEMEELQNIINSMEE